MSTFVDEWRAMSVPPRWALAGVSVLGTPWRKRRPFHWLTCVRAYGTRGHDRTRAACGSSRCILGIGPRSDAVGSRPNPPWEPLTCGPIRQRGSFWGSPHSATVGTILRSTVNRLPWVALDWRKLAYRLPVRGLRFQPFLR